MCVCVCLCLCVCVHMSLLRAWFFSFLSGQDMMGSTSNYRSVDIMRCWIRKKLVYFFFKETTSGKETVSLSKEKIATSVKGGRFSEQICLSRRCVRGDSDFRLLKVFWICPYDSNSIVKISLFSHECPNIHMGDLSWLYSQLLLWLSHLTFSGWFYKGF